VVRRLEEAGAVLVAKLSTGELAFDDLWFGGRTRILGMCLKDQTAHPPDRLRNRRRACPARCGNGNGGSILYPAVPLWSNGLRRHLACQPTRRHDGCGSMIKSPVG